MITQYRGEFREIAELFHRSVHQLAIPTYTQAQVEAWSPSPIDFAKWEARCELKRPYLYKVGSRVAGFIEVDTDGHIDCHYVHPDFVRRGIATELLEHVLRRAIALGLERLHVEASHLILPLYMKKGFVCLRQNTVTINGVSLDNWLLEKPLDSVSATNGNPLAEME